MRNQFGRGGIAAALCIAATAGCAGDEPAASPAADQHAGAALAAGEPLIRRVAPNSAVGDFDGDGLGDAAYGDPAAGRSTACPAGFGAIVVHAGADPTRAVRLARGAGLSGAATCGAALGTGLAAADIDGDGFDDLVVGAPGLTVGQIQVVFGSRAGLSSRQTIASGPTIDGAGARFGAAIAAGDFDCDGFADVAVAAPAADVGSAADAGAVTVLAGRAGGVAATGPRLVQTAFGDPAEPGDQFGFSLAAGDLDAGGPAECGCDDLAISAALDDVGAARDAGLVHVLYGGTSGPGSGGADLVAPSGAIASLPGQGMGSHLGIGDVDGDGIDDLSMTLSASDQLAWMAGGAAGLGPAQVAAGALTLDPTCGAEAKKGTVTITDIKVTIIPSGCDPCCGPGNCCIGGSCGGD
jgi:hypothetical protein